MMKPPPSEAEPATAERPSRPPLVDYALYALVARCVFSLASGFALFGARSEVTASLAKLHPDWSASKLHDNVNAGLKANLIATIVTIVLVLVIAKFIRDGRNWARWLYLVTAFLVTRDALQVTAFFQYHAVLLRVVSGLTGIAAVVAIVLLFLPASSHFFRRPGAMASLGGLFGPRGRARTMPAGTPPPAVESLQPEPVAELGSAEPVAESAAPRRQPRAKSRRVAE